jgi:hypothetical protein
MVSSKFTRGDFPSFMLAWNHFATSLGIYLDLVLAVPSSG